MPGELGSTWLSVLPDMSKLPGLVNKGMSSAAVGAGKAFSSAFGKNLGGVEKVFGDAGKKGGELLAKQALAAAKSDINKLSKQVATAMDAQANSAGRLRVAQERLNEVQAKGKTSGAELARAEEAVAAAQRKHLAETTKAEAAAKRLADANERAAKATEDLEKASKGANEAGKKTANGFTSAFRTSAKSGVEDALRRVDARRSGEEVGGRFGQGFTGALGGVATKAGVVLGGALATIGVGSLAKDSVGLEATFSQTMNVMAAVAKVPAAGIKELSALALQLGADTTYSAGEAATAMLELAKGGLDAATIKAGGLAGTLTLAAAGGTSLETAATIASNALASFSLKGSDMAAVAAALAGGANASTASVESLGIALSQVGPGAVQAGLSLQDTVGVLAAFDANGIKGSDAGTSLKTMLTRLVPQTDKAASAMKSLGLNFSDANGNFLPITNIAEQLKTNLSALSDEERTLALSTIFGSDAQRAASILMKEGAKGITQFVAATKDQNAANEAATARMAGTAGAMETFSGAVETAKLQLGQLLAPTVQKAMGNLSNGISAFAAAASGEGVTSNGFVGFMERLGVAARGTFLFFKGTVIPATKDFFGFLRDNQAWILPIVAGITAMVVAFKIYSTTLAVVRGITAAFTAAQLALNFALAANPIGLIVLAVIGLGVALVVAYKRSATFRKIVDAVGSALKTAFIATVSAVKTAIGAVVTAFHWVVDTAKTVGSALSAAWSAVVGAVKTAGSAVAGAFSAVVGAVRTAFGVVVDAVLGPVRFALGVLNAVWSRVAPILVLPFYVARKVITIAWQGIQAAFSAALSWVSSVFVAAWNNIVIPLTLPLRIAWQGIQAAWRGITAAFSAAKNWVVGVFSKAWSAVSGVVSGAVEAAKKRIDYWWAVIRAGFTAAKNWVTGTFAKTWAAVKNTLAGPISTAVGAIKSVLGGAKGGLQWVFSQAVTAIGRIWDGLKELAKAPVRFVIDTVMNNGLISGFNWVASKFDAPQIAPIPMPAGFAAGGEFDGRLPGRGSAVDNMLGWFKGKAVGLASGEFITNAKDTARALPLLRHINSGGELPDLGFANGGLFGSLKNAASSAFTAGKNFGADALKVLEDPVKWFTSRFAGSLNSLSQIGNSPVAQIVKAVPGKLADAIKSAAKNLLGLGGAGGPINPGLAGALSWARSQVGKPYLWGGVGPAGYDCSGFMSAIVNVIQGRSPYSRLFATGSLPAGMFSPGTGAFNIGWFTGNPGHVAGTLNGVNVESRGGRGVVVGPAARGWNDPLFNRHGHLTGYANGGLFKGDPPFDELDPRGKAYRGQALVPRSALSFDQGGYLPTGYSFVHNGTGSPEPVGHDVLRSGDLDGLRITLDTGDGVSFTGHIRATAQGEIRRSNRATKRRVGMGSS